MVLVALLLLLQVSSVELERAVVEGVPGVAEAAAVGVAAAGGGPEELVLFLVLRGGAAGAGGPGAAGAGAGGAGGSPAEVQAQLASLHKQCQAAVRSKLNPLFKVGTREARGNSVKRQGRRCS